MEFKKFVRTPFLVEAVEVTKENIEELAQQIGAIRHKEDGTPYIHVDKRLVPNVFRVFPGFWVTKMGDNIRCYSPKIFKEQFEEMTEGWEDYFGGTKQELSVTPAEESQVIASVEVE